MPSTKLQQFTVHFDNNEEFHHLKNELFTHDLYFFESENFAPRIIDAGAHIGLATLYFKSLFPGARITAIEPQPANLKLLEKNIWENRLDDVEIVPVALDAKAGEQQFFSDSNPKKWLSTAGFLSGAWNGGQNSEVSVVPTRPLSDFLTEPIDFLKMDIEGAEHEVLAAAKDQLHLVKHMMVEFHPHEGQNLLSFIKFLQEQGFTVTAWKDGDEVKPKHARGLVTVEGVR